MTMTMMAAARIRWVSSRIPSSAGGHHQPLRLLSSSSSYSTIPSVRSASVLPPRRGPVGYIRGPSQKPVTAAAEVAVANEFRTFQPSSSLSVSVSVSVSPLYGDVTTGRRSVSTLVLLRHGQSQWNGPKSRFTGWCDVPLTVRGRVEAVAAGQLLRSRGFRASRVCVAFTSELQRAHETCELALASMAGHEQNTWSSGRIRRDYRLNERHYGAVQGEYKEDPKLASIYGSDEIRHWRRSLHGRPPPMTPSHPYFEGPPAPLTESLQDCQNRVLECWEDSIAPALFQEEGLPFKPEQRTIIVVAHANTIRSLMAHFDDVPEDRIPNLHVPNSVPVLYRFNTETRRPLSIRLESAAGGSHARWMLSAENHKAVREAVQRGGTLTRALFDAMGANERDLTLSGQDLERGVRELMRDDYGGHIDCVVMGVAKRVARKLKPTDVIHIKEFEKLCQEGVDGLSLKHLNPEDDVAGVEHGAY